MTNEESVPAKRTCYKSRWLENVWKRRFQMKRRENPEFVGTSIDLIFPRSVDIADQYYITSYDAFFPFLYPLVFFPLLQASHSNPSVPSSPCKPITAKNNIL